MKRNLFTHFSLLAISAFTISTAGFSQTQKGTDIDGEATFDESGSALSMPDENTIAIGAAFNDGVAVSAGHVRIFAWDGNAWLQKGDDLNGVAENDENGKAISMPNASTIAIGAPRNDANGDGSGQVRVYSWNGSSWVQKGSDLNGDDANDRIGSSVSMPTENTLAVSGSNILKVYNWNGNAWVQKGIDIVGLNANDFFGVKVVMPDENTLAVGAPGAINTNGTVTIYSWNGSSWVTKGSAIVGEATGDQLGRSFDMPDANTIATSTDANGNGAGHVRVFSWDGSSWVQLGTDINGADADTGLGSNVSMPDQNTIGVSANGTTDFVRFYVWNGTNWVQAENDVLGEAADDELGWAIDMPAPGVIGIGAPYNDGNGNFSGHVRVFEIDNLSLSETASENLIVYPNPTHGKCTIVLDKDLNDASIRVLSVTGEQVFYKEINDNTPIEIQFDGAPGTYIAIIQSVDFYQTARIVKI
jgi:hypothetical protein